MTTANRVLHSGTAEAAAIRLDEPLSFWGGFDPVTGTIIDGAHPQVGQSLAGRIVVMPGSRGSSGTPGVLAEAIRAATGPAGFIVTKADINLTAGAVVAEALYGRTCPIVLVDKATFKTITDGRTMAIDAQGTIRTLD